MSENISCSPSVYGLNLSNPLFGLTDNGFFSTSTQEFSPEAGTPAVQIVSDKLQHKQAMDILLLRVIGFSLTDTARLYRRTVYGIKTQGTNLAHFAATLGKTPEELDDVVPFYGRPFPFFWQLTEEQHLRIIRDGGAVREFFKELRLSDIALQIMILRGFGWTLKEIGRQVGYSPHIIQKHERTGYDQLVEALPLSMVIFNEQKLMENRETPTNPLQRRINPSLPLRAIMFGRREICFRQGKGIEYV